MDEKKVREAIKEFEIEVQVFEDMISYCKYFEPKNDCGRYEEKIAMRKTAIEALEKQLAIKPKEVVGGICREFYECKNCGSEIEPLDIYEDYCKWCGQRLDWTES